MSSLWQWLGTGALAAIISALISWPKSRGEGKQAEGAGRKSLTEAQIAEQVETLRQTREQADRAENARKSADAARETCELQNRKIRADFEAFADVMEELIPLLPEGESQRKARVALRAARLVI